MENTFKYHLYGTDGCHLCEQAEELCEQFILAKDINNVDIIDSSKLVERYSIRIPVLERLSDGQELSWPFDLQQLQEFISGTN